MRRYLALLRSNRNLRLLFLVQLICYFGGWFSHTGIFTLLVELKAEVWIISLSAAMAFIPVCVLAPISGIVIDKYRPILLLKIFLVVECLSVLVLVLIDDIKLFWLIQILIFIRMGTAGIYFQVQMSFLPKILTKPQLKLANELQSIIWSLSYTAGLGLAGIFIYYFGVKKSFLFDVFLYIVGIYFLFQVKISELKPPNLGNSFQMLKQGLVYIKSNKTLLHLILIHSMIGITSYDTIVTLLANYDYKEILGTSLIIGYTNMSRAIALIIGPIILQKYINKTTLFYFIIGQGVGIYIWAILQFNFYLGFFGMLCAGFFTTTIWSYTYTLIQVNCDKHFYGRVVSYVDMIFSVVSVFILLFTGFLYEKGLSLPLVTSFLASLFIIFAFYYRWLRLNFKF